MGCHTWHYTLLDPQPTYEECKQYLLKNIDEVIDLLNGKYSFKDDGTESDEYLKEMMDMWLEEITAYWGSKERAILYHEKVREKIKNDRTPEAIKKRYKPIGKGVRYFKGKFYTYKYDGALWDVFRVHNYPDDTLTCYEDFEQFWNTHKCYPGIKSVGGDWVDMTEEDVKEKMKKFWEDHPDGIVDFG